jgi:hypothetical protein
MKNTFLQCGLAAALAVAAVSSAQAQSVFNTGTPTGGLSMANSIDAADWMAESFTLTSTTTIDSILAYAKSSADGVDAGQSFTVALYGSKTVSGALVPKLNWNAPNQGQLDQFTATYTQGGGWIGQTGLNWTLGAGTYFVAVEVGANDGVQGLVLPTGVSHVPSAVALYTGGQAYAADTTPALDAFGLQVMAVPEPNAGALMLAGFVVMAGALRRRNRR